MENLTTNNHQLVVDEISKANLTETARWAKFLAIMGFIFLGLIILLGFFMGTIMASKLAANSGLAAIGGIGFGLLYTAIAAIYFYPTYALYKFAVIIKPALAASDTHLLNLATGYLKGMFKYMGIVMIVMIALYALLFLFAGLGGIIAAMNT